MSNARAQAAVANVESLRDQALGVLEALTDAQWHSTTTAEGWPIGYVARHIAAGFGQSREWVEAGLAGTPAQVDRSAIDAANAAGVAAHGAGEREEVLVLVRSNAATLANIVGDLSEAQLDAPALLGSTGVASVETVATGLLGRHTLHHLDNIRATLGANERTTVA